MSISDALDFVHIGLINLVTETLTYDHRAELQASTISVEEAERARLWSEGNPAFLKQALNRAMPEDPTVLEYLFYPYFRPNKSGAQSLRAKRTGKEPSYFQPTGVPTGIYFPPGTRNEGRLQHRDLPLVFTEGEKKALVLDRTGWGVVGAPGVWNFHDSLAKRKRGERVLHPWITEDVALEGRNVVIAFDSDAAVNDQVVLAAEALEEMLRAAGVRSVRHVVWPQLCVRWKVGIDDWAAREGDEGVLALLEDAVAGAPGRLQRGGAITVPGRAVQDVGLSARDKVVLGRLNTGTRRNASASSLARGLGLSEDQVSRSLRKLVQRGHVAVERGKRRLKAGRWVAKPNSYVVREGGAGISVRVDQNSGETLALAMGVLRERIGRWVSTKELAEALGLSERTARRVIHELRLASGIQVVRGRIRAVRDSDTIAGYG